MAHGFIPVANTASVELIYTFQGVVIENVFHVQQASPVSSTSVTEIRSAFDTWDSVTQKSQRPVACVLNRIRTRGLDTSGSPMEDYTVPSGRAGTVAGTALPGNVTFAVKLSTGLGGRTHRGRVFWPGLTTTMVSGNQLQSATGNALVAAINTLITNLAALGTPRQLVVTSLFVGGAYRAAGVNTVVLNAAYVDLNLDSQRRRLTGRGI